MQVPERKLKILLLEDNADDVEFIKRQLLKDLKHVVFYWTTNEEEFLKGLSFFLPDVVLSDNFLPKFSAQEALTIVRERAPFMPFILVTGTVSEEFAVNIIKMGADDYILKDRMIRLSSAIDVAIKQRQFQKEINDYKYALDQSAIVCISDVDGTITYVNDNFCRITGYSADEILGQNFRVLNSGYHPPTYFKQLWTTITKGELWRGEFLNKDKHGNNYWIASTIIPFLNAQQEPSQYLVIGHNTTEKKKLEAELLEQYRNEQLKMTATALEAQEKERNLIGQEMHDNLSQILVGTKLIVTKLINDKSGYPELLAICQENLQHAIDENRKIAHRLVTPDIEKNSFYEELETLCDTMLTMAGINVQIDHLHCNEELLSDAQKLTVYRIAQEQCTNIIKYAAASHVQFNLVTSKSIFHMTIADDGRGMQSTLKSKGIGLKNIEARLSIYKGVVRVHSTPGKGFTLEIDMPCL